MKNKIPPTPEGKGNKIIVICVDCKTQFTISKREAEKWARIFQLPVSRLRISCPQCSSTGPEEKKKCEHKNHDCLRGQCNDCGYCFDAVCNPHHIPDKLAEAWELLKEINEDFCRTQKDNTLKISYPIEVILKAIEAQNLVSRAEQKKADAEKILQAIKFCSHCGNHQRVSDVVASFFNS